MAQLSIPRLVTSAQLTALTANDGDHVLLQVDATNGINWPLRYNNASPSAYKWEVIGGPPLFAEVAVGDTRGNTAYGVLPSAGPAITLPRIGDYLVIVGFTFQSNLSPGTASGFMSYTIGGTAASDADAANATSTSNAASGTTTGLKERLKTDMLAVTLTAQYRTDTSNAGGTFSKRYMKVIPIRLG